MSEIPANPHCECPVAGFCQRHQNTKTERQHRICQGVAVEHPDCGYKFWKAWETGRLGATAPAEPKLAEWEWCSSIKIQRGRKEQGLGDYTENVLKSLGVTEERYSEIKEKFGLSPRCNCSGRKKWLNSVGKYLGIGS